MFTRRKALQMGIASTALGVVNLAAAQKAPDAAPAKQTYAEVECEIRQLIARMNAYYDEQMYDEMLDLYTDDAIFNSPPARRDLRGKAEILAEISKSPKNRLVRHLMTNTIVDQHDENNASARCYVFAGQNIGGRPLVKAVPMVGAPVFGEFHFKLRRENGVWKIQKKQTIEVFAGQTVTL